MVQLAASALPKLRARVDDATKGDHGVPGLVYCVVNKKGERIFEHAAGTIGKDKETPMTAENVFWIASCTKLVTGIACMQLVEQGKLLLDSVEQVEEIAPELKAVQVLDENGVLVPKERGITLRMLLSHTAGFGYSFYNARLNDHYGPIGLNEFSGSAHDYLSQPLVNQPGTRWEYGISLDWVGVIIERTTKTSLDDYMTTHIFEPLGIQDSITFFPTSRMRSQLTYFNQRLPPSSSSSKLGPFTLRTDGHPLHAQLQAINPRERSAILNSGGAGLFAQPRAFTQIISTLLNNGLHFPSNTRLLKSQTVETMFTNQLPHLPQFGRIPIKSTKPDLALDVPELYGAEPEGHKTPQGWGLSFFLHVRRSNIHSEGTAWWAGLPNLFWWCDRRAGIGGILASQVLPSGDDAVMKCWTDVERGIYKGLIREADDNEERREREKLFHVFVSGRIDGYVDGQDRYS